MSNFFWKKVLKSFLHNNTHKLDNYHLKKYAFNVKLRKIKEICDLSVRKKVKISPLLANLAKFRPFSGWIWPKVKFRAFLAKISCPKFSKCSSAIWIKFRTFYEISDNLAALFVLDLFFVFTLLTKYCYKVEACSFAILLISSWKKKWVLFHFFIWGNAIHCFDAYFLKNIINLHFFCTFLESIKYSWFWKMIVTKFELSFKSKNKQTQKSWKGRGILTQKVELFRFCFSVSQC